MKHKVVIECENEEEANWFIQAVEEARKRWSETGGRVNGVIAGILLDRAGLSLSAMRFEVDPVVRDLAERLDDAASAMNPEGLDFKEAKEAVEASGVTLPDQPPTLYDSLRADDHNAKD